MPRKFSCHEAELGTNFTLNCWVTSTLNTMNVTSTMGKLWTVFPILQRIGVENPIVGSFSCIIENIIVAKLRDLTAIIALLLDFKAISIVQEQLSAMEASTVEFLKKSCTVYTTVILTCHLQA